MWQIKKTWTLNNRRLEKRYLVSQVSISAATIPLCLQCTHLLMTTSSRIMHVTKLKSSQTGFLNMTMSSLYSNGLHSHQISINRAPLGCGGTGNSHHGCAADKSAATAWCYHVNMDQIRNVSNTLLNLCHEELSQFWRQKGVQPGTSKVYLIKWPWPVSIYIHSAAGKFVNPLECSIVLHKYDTKSDHERIKSWK